jgi:hypothetical protein
MPEAREEDEVDQVPIPLKNVSPAIPKNELELKELIEDLTRMGCEGLLAKPWNLRSEATWREFMFERGNQWFRTIRQDPEKWTAEVSVEVYGFPPRKGEGWASHKDSLYVRKFRGEHDPRKATAPQPRNEAGPNRKQSWRDIDLSTWELPETPFKRVRAKLTNLQNEYWRLEHITRGVSRALGNSGPGNILRELARKMDRSKVDALKTEKAQLAAHVAAMTRELT